MAGEFMNWAIAILQTFLFVALSPLLAGFMKFCKCRLQNRRTPSLFQPYKDLLKLTRKQPVISENASWLFCVAPYIIFTMMILAATVIPLIAVDMPTSESADVIVLVGFFAFARFFLALAGLDVGTAFGGMGSSREMTISSLAEPAMLMAVFTITMTASNTDLSGAIHHILNSGSNLHPSFVFALFALILVAVAETGRIPVDNPTTHLELTMIHEAMILEYSGRHLALIEWASQLKLMLYGVLIANLFFPFGIAQSFTFGALSFALFVLVLKLVVLSIFLAVAETAVAKMRLFRVQEYLGFAYLLGLLGMLSHIILEFSR